MLETAPWVTVAPDQVGILFNIAHLWEKGQLAKMPYRLRKTCRSD